MTLPGPDAASSTEDDTRFPADATIVGRVLGAWGIKGGIRVQPFSRDPAALLGARRWFIQPPEGLAAKPGTIFFPPLLDVVQSKVHGDSVVATARQLADRNAAEAMQGCRIFVARANFPTTGIGEYYWVDLIGLAVLNRQGVALGTVTDLIDTGAHSVLRVRRPDAVEGAPLDATERLIPFVAAFIDEVSLDQRRITVDWGLDF